MSLSDIKQGELVVADILFAEQVGIKRRFALVISNDKFNMESGDIIVLKVTSHGGNTTFDVPLRNSDTTNKTLKKDSTILVDFPATIAKQNIVARPDNIKEEKLQKVKQKIKELFEL